MTDAEIVNQQAQQPSRIELFLTRYGVTDENLKGYRAIVIDVLRSATSITLALKNGAQYVIPASSVDAASDLASQLPRDDMLLCGERDAKSIDGFDLGNSPSEYTREMVRGRRLIFASTDGTPALVKASYAKSVYLCGFVNMNHVVDAILSQPDPFPLAIICAGKHARLSMEDTVCGGMLISRIVEKLDSDVFLNDAARSTEIIAEKLGNDPLEVLKTCDHGRYLAEIGMGNDLEACAADSIYDVVPVLQDGRLVKLNIDKPR